MDANDFTVDVIKIDIPKLRTYEIKKGDLLDEKLGAYLKSKTVKIPIIRIKPNKYLVGTNMVMARINNSQILFRVGGGWERMETYLSKHEEEQL
jgi:hypothetical protein